MKKKNEMNLPKEQVKAKSMKIELKRAKKEVHIKRNCNAAMIQCISYASSLLLLPLLVFRLETIHFSFVHINFKVL